MKALVTGGGGFLGKAIVLKLLERGDEVRSFSRGDYPELRRLGVEVVREMNRLGIMVDVSHASDQSFYDAIELSRAPLIASHSCARALCDHPRNLSDDLLLQLKVSSI